MESTDDGLELTRVLSAENINKQREQQPTLQNTETTPFGCVSRGKHFETVQNLKEHPCPVPVSNSECTPDTVMEQHNLNLGKFLKMNSKKPFVCQLCSKAFKSRRESTGHFLVHIGARFSTCSRCGDLFFKVGLLSKYEIRALGKPIKKDVCSGCSRALSKGTRVNDKERREDTCLPQEEASAVADRLPSVAQHPTDNGNEQVEGDSVTPAAQQDSVRTNTNSPSDQAQHDDGNDKTVVDEDTLLRSTIVKQEVEQEEMDPVRIPISFSPLQCSKIKQEVMCDDENTEDVESSSNLMQQDKETVGVDMIEDAASSSLVQPTHDDDNLCIRGLLVCSCGEQFKASSALDRHRSLDCRLKSQSETNQHHGRGNTSTEADLFHNGTTKNGNSEVDCQPRTVPEHTVVCTTNVRKLFVCNPCGRQFTRVYYLMRHRCAHNLLRHRRPSPKLWPCSFCKDVFYLKRDLLSHKLEHLKSPLKGNDSFAPLHESLDNLSAPEQDGHRKIKPKPRLVGAVGGTNNTNGPVPESTTPCGFVWKGFRCKLCKQEFPDLESFNQHALLCQNANAKKVGGSVKKRTSKLKSKGKYAKGKKHISTKKEATKVSKHRRSRCHRSSKARKGCTAQKIAETVNASSSKGIKHASPRSIAPKSTAPKPNAPLPILPKPDGDPLPQGISIQTIAGLSIDSQSISNQPISHQAPGSQPSTQRPVHISSQPFVTQSISLRPLPCPPTRSYPAPQPANISTQASPSQTFGLGPNAPRSSHIPTSLSSTQLYVSQSISQSTASRSVVPQSTLVSTRTIPCQIINPRTTTRQSSHISTSHASPIAAQTHVSQSIPSRPIHCRLASPQSIAPWSKALQSIASRSIAPRSIAPQPTHISKQAVAAWPVVPQSISLQPVSYQPVNPIPTLSQPLRISFQSSSAGPISYQAINPRAIAPSSLQTSARTVLPQSVISQPISLQLVPAKLLPPKRQQHRLLPVSIRKNAQGVQGQDP
ncbi:uncharacterized protein LOC119734237 [Patiria miniata]|uniref:C2H2-type domain-containing protein n=1 Tax=Patiria miniata TaxID=46514 RepID=A0A914AHR3_PATMI|nr:uncharacterized protein LOC119734237 [Patiria miniata]